MKRTIIDDPRGCVAADYAEAWRRGRVEWLLRESPRNVEALSRARLVVDGNGTSFRVRALTGGV